MNFSGTMEQALEKSYDETCAILQVTKMREVSGKNYDAKEPKKSFRDWEYIRGSGGIKVNNGTPYPDEYGLELFVIKINNRFERIAIVKSGTNKGDGIAGVWQGLSMSVGAAKPGAELGAELNVKQLILFSNGQAYFGKNFPSEGLNELNTWVKAENNRRDWGTYSFSNGKGVLKLAYADIPLRIENNKLIITTNKTDHGFIKLSPVDGSKFNGTYVMNEAYGKIPSITFTADGRFTDNGAVKVLYHEYIDCINAGLMPGSGTYEINDYTITFHYTDGRKIKIAFLRTEHDLKNQSPATLTMSSNEDPMIRQ
jgi:hypothetical protein